MRLSTVRAVLEAYPSAAQAVAELERLSCRAQRKRALAVYWFETVRDPVPASDSVWHGALLSPAANRIAQITAECRACGLCADMGR